MLESTLNIEYINAQVAAIDAALVLLGPVEIIITENLAYSSAQRDLEQARHKLEMSRKRLAWLTGAPPIALVDF